MSLENKDFWFIGGLFFSTGLYLTIKQLMFVIKAEKTIGVITSIYHPRTENGKSQMSFQYSYNSRIITITTTAGSYYHVGQNIRVLYNKNDPLDAYINSFFSLFGIQFGFLVFGSVFIYIPFS